MTQKITKRKANKISKQKFKKNRRIIKIKRRFSNEIKLLYDKFGSRDYIGEKMTQIQHAEQCAALAKVHGCREIIIVAALLHDIGHLVGMKNKFEEMKGLGTLKHELIGSKFYKHVI